MNDNRRLALETAHTFGHKDHKHLLKTAMDIEWYLEKGERAPIPGETKIAKLELSNEFVRDMLEVYKIDIIDWFVQEVTKLKFTKPLDEIEVNFSVNADINQDGNVDFSIYGEKKTLTNSKKK